ncbi:minor capsid protein [Burkholderia multivorans]|uniref:phage minor head protein n=1 Tax=Burkholderia multivorans TaxID=87883 RepID=UPI00158B5BFA|nr:phage minor head protein [Burkholderia multivorans]MBU9534680.1 minor capsid protein [Burkholderia multivorans]
MYRTHLRKIAKHVEDLFDGFPLGDLEAVPTIEQLLRRYAEALTPWAEATAARMLEDLNRRDEQAWMQNAREMSRALRDELRRAPTGETMRALMAEQVTLIKSIPLEAAKRVHRLTIEALEDSTRAAQISKAIQESGEVAKSRADLIARTEVARTASKLTEARALHVGSPGYFWRTSGDSDVRDSHRKMNGQFVRWDDPPTLDGMTGHAGQFPNCRCWCEVVVPED